MPLQRSEQGALPFDSITRWGEQKVGMRQEYRPEIDGLRAIAVLGVLLFHLKVEVFRGGYSGVDVFFVISGYLISRNILHDVAAKKFSFAEFYARRIRRIFPPLFVVVVGAFVAGLLFFPPDELKSLANSATASLLSISNIYFWRESHNYFAPASDYLPLLHVWSLSVEEQFYLLWPLFLLLLARMRVSLIVPAAIALVSVVSLVAAQRWLSRDPSSAFYLTPFRIYQFGIGALLLFVEDRLRPMVVLRLIIFLFGGLLIAVSYCGYDINSRVPTLAASLGAMCLIGAGRVPLLSLVLTNRGVTAVGKMSYSLYLCHWPIIVFARYIWGDVKEDPRNEILVVLVMLICSVALHFCVEKRFRALPAHAGKKHCVRIFGSFAALIVATLGLTVAAAQSGWLWRLSDHQQEFNRAEKFGIFPCRQSHANDCVFGDSGGPLGVVLIGDSYAQQYVAGLHWATKTLGLRGAAYTHGGCLGLLGVRRINFIDEARCHEGRDASLALAKSTSAPIIIAQAWMGYAQGAIGDEDSKPFAFASESERLAILRMALEKTIRFFGSDRSILIVGAQVLASCHAIEAYRFGTGPLWHKPPSDCAPLPLADAQIQTEAINAMLRSVQSQFSNQVSLLLPQDYLCDSVCHFQNKGVWLYQDEGHLTVGGSEYIAKGAEEQLKGFLSQR